MRHKVMGSTIGPGTNAAPVAPLKLEAIMMISGGISASVAVDSYLYPKLLDVDTMIKYRWLYKSWKLNGTSHRPLVDVTKPEVTIVWEVIMTSTAANESELSSAQPPQFVGTSSTGTVTTNNGVDPPLTVPYNAAITRFGVCQIAGSPVPVGSPDPYTYWFNSTSGLYLPRIELEVDGWTGFVQADDGNVNTSRQEFNSTWDGSLLKMQAQTATTYPLDSFTLTAVPHRYWEYRDSNGQNPIWDAVTGIEIGDHNTLLN